MSALSKRQQNFARMTRSIDRCLAITAAHFGLKPADVALCREAAMAHPKKAEACYAAIARSLVKR